MKQASIFNRDIKSDVIADSYPQPRRYGYLLLAGLAGLILIALLSGRSEPARALQSEPAAVTAQDSITEALTLPQPSGYRDDDAPAQYTPPPAATATAAKVKPATTEVPADSTAVANIKPETLPAPAAGLKDKQETGNQDEHNWHEVTVKSGDSLAVIFDRLDIAPQQLHALLEEGGAAHNLKKIHPGQTLRVRTDKDRGLLALSYPIDKLSTLEVTRDGDAFDISTTHRTPERREVSASAIINSSLFLAGSRAGMSDEVTMELAGIFGWDIDFALDIRKGDSFTVIYEEIYLDGEHIDNGEILAAEFINQGKRYQAIRYTDAGGRTDYYALNGESMRKTFLRTPVEFSRISSRFNLKRKHPVLNRIRAHKGVDYAASTGTPVKSTANGKIIHIGNKGGYGKTVVVQHGTRYSTLYAHLSKYRGGLKNGSRVRQGQTIGYVGSSGLATGPHLHYELRVDGTHRDPLRVKLPGADPLNKKYMADFTSRAETLLAQIDLVRDVQVASNQ